MRVLVVSTEFPPGPGGVGTHAWELARNLARRGWPVTVLASQDYASDEDVNLFKRQQPFPVRTWRRRAFGPASFLWRLAALWKTIRSVEPTLVVASGSRAVLGVSLVLRGPQLPWVAVGHGTEFAGRGFMSGLLRRAFRRASAVVCVSEHTRRLVEDFGVHPRIEAVIPNGADPETFRPIARQEADEIRRRLGVPDGRVVITVGNVSRRKAQDVVVRALPLVAAEIRDVQYLVVGLPTDAAKVRRLAQELGVAERVHVVGALKSEDLVRALNASDLFVLTSRRTAEGDVEGFGIAVIEAALCSKAAIVTSGSGLTEAIAEGETGVSVPADDPESTAAAIVALLSDPARLQEMGRRARERALREQTWECRIGSYEEVFRRVLGSGLDAPAAVTRP